MAKTAKRPDGYSWALPRQLKVPPDTLRARLDLYESSMELIVFNAGHSVTKIVSPEDVTRAFLKETRLTSGLLPAGALWWSHTPSGPQVALYRPPQVWQAALQMEAFGAPRRFRLPMPGLIFVCSPARPPRVVAVKRRPDSEGDPLYHAPLYNIFQDGYSCPGTHKYPERVQDVPESFFTSFFSPTGHTQGRSRTHPTDLGALWTELDGQAKYPMSDLVEMKRTVKDLMSGGR